MVIILFQGKGWNRGNSNEMTEQIPKDILTKFVANRKYFCHAKPSPKLTETENKERPDNVKQEAYLWLSTLGKIFSRWYTEIFFLFFLQNSRIWHFMQIVSKGDNVHEKSKLVSGKIKIISLICCLLY